MATNSDPTIWKITTIDADGDSGGDSAPTDWVTTSIDDQPADWDGDSNPTAWIIAQISPEFPAEEDSDPTSWIIATIDATALASGIFLVITGGTLVPIEMD